MSSSSSSFSFSSRNNIRRTRNICFFKGKKIIIIECTTYTLFAFAIFKMLDCFVFLTPSLELSDQNFISVFFYGLNLNRHSMFIMCSSFLIHTFLSFTDLRRFNCRGFYFTWKLTSFLHSICINSFINVPLFRCFAFFWNWIYIQCSFCLFWIENVW